MTDRKQALTELLEKVEAGEFDAPPSSARAPFFNAFMDIADIALPKNVTSCSGIAWRAYNMLSLDAAKALHEAVLPGWDYAIYVPKGFQPEVQLETETMRCLDGFEPLSGLADNPARAWLIAIIKALIAMEKDNG